MDQLDSDDRAFLNSQEIRGVFEIAWMDDRVSSFQRGNARELLEDLLIEEGMIFDDVFDYDEWRDWYEST